MYLNDSECRLYQCGYCTYMQVSPLSPSAFLNISRNQMKSGGSSTTSGARCFASRHEDVPPRFVPPAPVAALEEHLAAAQEPKLVVRRTFFDLEVGFPRLFPLLIQVFEIFWPGSNGIYNC